MVLDHFAGVGKMVGSASHKQENGALVYADACGNRVFSVNGWIPVFAGMTAVSAGTKGKQLKKEGFMSKWQTIDKKKAKLDSLRPLPEHTLKSLQEKIALEWTYHSNAIEGNTLTLKETKVALEGITIGGKSVKEHLEAINHNEAVQYLYQMIRNKEKISEWQIKQIHALILKNIDAKNAGTYRKENVLISGAEHTPLDYTIVPEKMQNMIKDYQDTWSTLHPVERSARLHIAFVKIHPFVDGNGRTARLVHNFELMKKGFSPIVIKKENRLEYYNALDKAHTTGNTEDFMKLIADCLNKSLDLYLHCL